MALESRVAAAFKGADPSEVAHFADEVRQNWREAERAFSRVAVLLVLMAAAFVLTNNASAEEVTLVFVKVSDFGAIRVVLPVVFAYLCYSMFSLFAEIVMLTEVHDATMRHVRPALDGQDLLGALSPPNSSLLGSERLSRSLPYGGRLAKLVEMTAWARLLLYAAAPLAFEVYAFWQLFRAGPVTWVVLVSAAVTGVLLVASGLMAVTALESYAHDAPA